MKKQSLQFLAIAMLISISAVIVSASSFGGISSSDFRVDVPFDFQIGKKNYPAGEYTVKRVRTRTGQGQIIIENRATGKQRYVFGAMSVRTSRNFTKFTLSFNRYGDTHFLREVISPDAEFSVSQSKAEKKVRKMLQTKPMKRSVLGS